RHVGAADAAKPVRPRRRQLLKERNIPWGGGENAGELLEQVAVHLHMRRVSLLDSEQRRAPSEQRRIRREVAAVEDVPGGCVDLHVAREGCTRGRTIPRFPWPAISSPETGSCVLS